MHTLISKLIIYRDLPDGDILSRMADICRRVAVGDEDRESMISDLYSCVHSLLDIATRYGFDGNLWQCYLAYLLAMTETPFTLVCEKEGALEGSVNTIARSDLEIFKKLFEYDFTEIEKSLSTDCLSLITDYRAVVKKERIYNKEVSEKVKILRSAIANAADTDECFSAVTGFYRDYGVGMLGMNRAFRVSDSREGELLIPITSTMDVTLDDLVGYETQKQTLISNTEAFVEGRRANNVLLYGDAGTGKSTSIKAILNMYYDSGLRMIEIYKHQFRDLSRVIARVKNRNYKFIIYMDDLSFEEFETDYKYLKAVIEGGLEVRPDNVLIYATSNRRHLIREKWSDKRDADSDDIHHNDTVQEKLSLAARFGISIGYFRPDPRLFRQIVTELADRHSEIELSNEELLAEANKWEMSHGGISGRTAQQFIDFLLSQRSAGTAGQ